MMKDEHKTKKQLIQELAQMRLQVAELETAPADRRQTEQQLYARRERVKELNCLYGAAKLMADPGRSLEQICQGIVDLIPPAWQYPEVTCARITIGGQQFETDDFNDTAWRQSADIMVLGEKVGAVDVGYLQEKPQTDEGPFLQEERHLLDALAGQIGTFAERKRAEQALRESEELYRALVENIDLGITLISRDHKIIITNPAIDRMLNRPPSQLVGRDCFREFEKRDAVCAHCPGTPAMATGQPAEVQTEGVREDGSRFPVRIWASPVFGPDGAITGFIEVVEDITERKGVQDRLRLLSSAVEQSTEGIAVADLEGNMLFTNKAFAAMHGYTPEELLGKRLSIFHTPEQMESVEAANRQVRRTGEFSGEIWHVRRDGGVFPSVMSNSLLRDEAGNPIGMVGTLRDITDRKQAEEALREGEEKYRVLAEANPASIFLLDHDGRFLYLNQACARVMGREHADLIGKQLVEVLPAEQAMQMLGNALQVFREDRVVEREDAILFGEEMRHFVTVLGPIHDAKRDVVSVIGIAHDITEQRQAEEQIQDYARRLESANTELARSNRELQDFTYTASHELQEPLRKIHTFGQFLAEDCGDALPQEGRQHLRRMQEAAVRMKGLIQHLMVVARVGTQGGELVPVDPREVIDKVLEDMSMYLRECGGEVTVEGELPTVMADAVQLGQVFQNIVSNALKFQPPEQAPRITIAGRVEGDQTVFRVADNGIGIEERFLQKIFGIFQRLYPRDQYEGAGVGLALCEKIVHRHGGMMWAESELGEGSTFQFTLRTASMTGEQDP